MSTSASGSVGVDAVTSPTGLPASASSSSRARLTPIRSDRRAPAPHAWQTRGRAVPHRPQTSRSPAPSPTFERHTAHLVTSPHRRQASSRARPTRLRTKRSLFSVSGDGCDPVGPQPRAGVVGSAIDYLDPCPSVPFSRRLARRPEVGRAPSRRSGTVTPARTARRPVPLALAQQPPPTTSARLPTGIARRAHRGRRSRLRAGAGAKTAARVPMTTRPPPAASRHPSGIAATGTPRRRRRSARRSTSWTAGTSTMRAPLSPRPRRPACGRSPVPAAERLPVPRRLQRSRDFRDVVCRRERCSRWHRRDDPFGRRGTEEMGDAAPPNATPPTGTDRPSSSSGSSAPNLRNVAQGDTGRRLGTDTDHPAPHAAAVQIDADHRAHLDLWRAGRQRVVELL